MNASNAIDSFAYIQLPSYADEEDYLRHYLARHCMSGSYASINAVVETASEIFKDDPAASMDAITQSALICSEIFNAIVNHWIAKVEPPNLQPLASPVPEVNQMKDALLNAIEVNKAFMSWPEDHGLRNIDFLDKLKPVALDLANYIFDAISRSAKAPENGTLLPTEIAADTDQEAYDAIHGAMSKIATGALNSMSAFQIALIQKSRQFGWDEVGDTNVYSVF